MEMTEAATTPVVADQPSVQTPEAMQQEIVGRLPLMRQLSEQLYSVWIKGLQR